MSFHDYTSSTGSTVFKYSLITLFGLLSLVVNAAETEDEKESPWLLVPTISSDPKLGSAVGFMTGYLKKFDAESPASMFGAMGSYSDTDSFFMAYLPAAILIMTSSAPPVCSSMEKSIITMKIF